MCVTGRDGWQNDSLYSLQCISNVGVIKTARTLTYTDGVLYMYCTYLRAACTQNIQHLLPLIVGAYLNLCVTVVLVQTLVLSQLIFVLTSKANICVYIRSFKVCKKSYRTLGILLVLCWTMYAWESCSNNFYRPDDDLHVRLLLKHNSPCKHLVNMSQRRNRQTSANHWKVSRSSGSDGFTLFYGCGNMPRNVAPPAKDEAKEDC